MGERCRSASLFARGILRRFWAWIPAFVLDPLDLFERIGFGVALPDLLFYLVLGLGVFIAAAFTYHEARLDAPGDESAEAIQTVNAERYEIGGSHINLGEIVCLLQRPLLKGIAEDQLSGELLAAMHFTDHVNSISNISVPAGEILADLLQAGLVQSQRIDPSPGAPSSIRSSLHDLPYDRYSLNALGRKVLRRLERRGEPEGATAR